jgi:putative Holliday junction resolvase
MRVIGLDTGTRRIGVALSDTTGRLASPVETVAGADVQAACQRIAQLVIHNDAVAIVVGLPIDMTGKEGPAVRRTRNFTRVLTQATPVPVLEWDERLSSAQAERSLLANDLRRDRRKEVLDQAAAVLILQAWLDSPDRRAFEARLRNPGTGERS